jgi:hypothetical protein
VQVRKYQVGAYEEQALTLLNELGLAFVTLTDDESRAQYDRSLSSTFISGAGVEDIAAEVLGERLPPPRPPAWTEADKPTRVPPRPTKPAPQLEAPSKIACPQCGKPMPAASSVCYQCGYKRAAPAAGKAKPVGAGQPAAGAVELPEAARVSFSATELLRQDLSPEQLLSRLQTTRALYRARQLADRLLTPGSVHSCHFCMRSLRVRSDTYALESATLCQLEEYLLHVARRLEALGKEQFTWPPPDEELARISGTVVGGNPHSMRLFCRACTERMLKSRRIAR